jgi:diguanylate cyclase (GGDEF)-like protein
VASSSARAIEAEVGLQDQTWRAGGDEFVILIPSTSAESALNLAERVRTSVSRVRVEHQDCALTMTLAVARSHNTVHTPRVCESGG